MVTRKAHFDVWIGLVALVAIEPFLAVGALGHRHSHRESLHSHGLEVACSHGHSHCDDTIPQPTPVTDQIVADQVAAASGGTPHSEDCSLCRHLGQLVVTNGLAEVGSVTVVTEFRTELVSFDVSDPARRLAQPRSPPC